MAIASLKSLQEQSPNVNIGFLLLPAADVNLVTQELRDTSRIFTRKVTNHFVSWNPTQVRHKHIISSYSLSHSLN